MSTQPISENNLAAYCAVALGNTAPKFVQAKQEKVHGGSLLDELIHAANHLEEHCILCERRCGVNRLRGETGFCGLTQEVNLFFEQILWGEEAPLIPSHEVFLSGCNLRCSYCYSWQAIENPHHGHSISPNELAGIIDSRHREGAINLNLLGGEPTVNLPFILEALSYVTESVPIVWNSNFMMSKECMDIIGNIVDLYVGDFRFGNNNCANKHAQFDKYFETAARNFKIATKQSDVILRHLVLPKHFDCCFKPIADWIHKELPHIPFHVMFQYSPFYKALQDPELSRTLHEDEKEQVIHYVKSLDLNTNIWNRSISSNLDRKPNGKGLLETTVLIGPTGDVRFLHFHDEMKQILTALNDGKDSD